MKITGVLSISKGRKGSEACIIPMIGGRKLSSVKDLLKIRGQIIKIAEIHCVPTTCHSFFMNSLKSSYQLYEVLLVSSFSKRTVTEHESTLAEVAGQSGFEPRKTGPRASVLSPLNPGPTDSTAAVSAGGDRWKQVYHPCPLMCSHVIVRTENSAPGKQGCPPRQGGPPNSILQQSGF